MSFKMSKVEKPRGYSEIDLDSQYRSFDRVAIKSFKHWVVVDKSDDMIALVGVPDFNSSAEGKGRVTTLIFRGSLPVADTQIGQVFAGDRISTVATLQSVRIVEIDNARNHYVAEIEHSVQPSHHNDYQPSHFAQY